VKAVERRKQVDFQELQAQRLRTARQHALRRDANERTFVLRGRVCFTQYVCECALKSCGVRVSLTPSEYLEVRREATYFLIACGHWTPVFERVVFETDRYLVVETAAKAVHRANDST
jgi:hypothetical protein